MTIAGIVLLLSFFVSVLLLTTSPSDSGQRGAGHGALLAASWLTILWVLFAAVLAATRWRATGFKFRTILVINAAIVCLLGAELWFH
jgi:hypothetical protein